MLDTTPTTASTPHPILEMEPRDILPLTVISPGYPHFAFWKPGCDWSGWPWTCDPPASMSQVASVTNVQYHVGWPSKLLMRECFTK